MIPLTLDQVADVVGGELADSAAAGRRVDGVVIDSRQVEDGSLFVPLRGEHVDGHDFIADAAGRGAAGWLWEARRTPPDLPGGVVVDDPGDALLGLGAWVRDQVDPTVVAVTGSSGKTTTKDLIAAAVGVGRRTVASPGSYNNELGVPLTCCLLRPDSEVLALEMGTRGVGHLARLAQVVAPDIAVVTTVGPSHLELLGTVETVARAKAELVATLRADGLAVLNADDPRVAAMAASAPCPVVTYGTGSDAHWRATDVRLDELARAVFTVRGVTVRLPVPGSHNVGNALAALAVADACGVDLAAAAAALGRAAVSRWRMQLDRSAQGVTVVNDAYNANPASVEAALRTLAAMDVDGRRWAVLGHMAELGAASADAHERIGMLCGQLGLDGLMVVGEPARGIHDAAYLNGFSRSADLVLVIDAHEALSALWERLRPGDAVLVKASRVAGLERVAEGLLSGPPPAPASAAGGGRREDRG
ncbi:MAG TPA: UDP-N-acetylmuramoyl-tripeptide--D-alanyl-D-alanine ligase [Egibacteraceae bacterium]|nr:UDP-N-acetylmuramoyl-tripeptide--D-alanyl-D-alanine ligase [Actinomycetota bacterium]HWB71837.1 UDP-N-acetylmuramoyl-tripeptide--D-alanyl-D-alanine ligase [Egibacteraceae bacterium]